MRILGWLFLLGGFLLCASIAWATIGFLFMGLGLVCLRIAERKSERAERPVALLAEKPEGRRGLLSIVHPVVVRKEANEPEPKEAEPDHNIGLRAYDQQRWRLLLSTDEDIRRLTTIMAHYGQSYVDEFAAAYLALNDKEHLPMILEQLMASAMRNRHQGTANSFDEGYDESVVGRNARETRRSDRLRDIWSEADGRTSNSVFENDEVKGDSGKAGSLHTTTGKADSHLDADVARGVMNTEALCAPNGAGSEGGVAGVRPIAGQATEPLPPAEPLATAHPDTTRRTLGEGPLDGDSLTNILSRISKP